MTTVADIVSTMKSKFNASAAAGLDLVFQFNIEDGDNHYLVVKDGTCEVVQGDAENPNVTLIMDSETLKGITSGETDGMQAFMAGKLRAEGDMMLGSWANCSRSDRFRRHARRKTGVPRGSGFFSSGTPPGRRSGTVMERQHACP